MTNIEKLVRFCEENDDDSTLIPAFLAILEIIAAEREVDSHV